MSERKRPASPRSLGMAKGRMLSFDEVIASVGPRPHLRLLAIDGLPLAGKTTLADRLAAAIGGACVPLDDFIRPEREWRWRDLPSFPFDFIRYDEFVGAVRSLATDGECRYRPWDYRTGERAAAERVVRLDGPVIVEGVTALHPDLAPLYDLRVWVESDAATVLDAARARGVGSTSWRRVAGSPSRRPERRLAVGRKWWMTTGSGGRAACRAQAAQRPLTPASRGSD